MKAEVERIWKAGKVILVDVDVKGGIRLKSIFGDDALSVFVMPPSIEALRERLVGRGTDAPETIERRVAKAEYEISFADRFDYILVNDNLDTAIAEIESLVNDFLKN